MSRFAVRRHPSAAIYLDAESASLLSPQYLKTHCRVHEGAPSTSAAGRVSAPDAMPPNPIPGISRACTRRALLQRTGFGVIGLSAMNFLGLGMEMHAAELPALMSAHAMRLIQCG